MKDFFICVICYKRYKYNLRAHTAASPYHWPSELHCKVLDPSFGVNPVAHVYETPRPPCVIAILALGILEGSGQLGAEFCADFCRTHRGSFLQRVPSQ